VSAASLKEWSEFIRSVVRPFIVIWGFMVYGICIMSGLEVPVLLAGLVTTVIAEYFGERAIRRIKENG